MYVDETVTHEGTAGVGEAVTGVFTDEKNYSSTMGHAYIFWPLNIILCVVTSAVNTLTLVVIARTPKLQTMAYLYIASLAVSDLLVAACIVPGFLWLHPATHYVFEERPWLCGLMKWWGLTALTCSLLSVTLVAVDRYLYIVHPFLYARRATPAKAKGAIAFVYVISAVIALLERVPNMVASSSAHDDRPFPGCGASATVYDFNRTVVVFHGVAILVTLSLMSLAYGLLLHLAVKQARTVEAMRVFTVHVQPGVSATTTYPPCGVSTTTSTTTTPPYHPSSTVMGARGEGGGARPISVTSSSPRGVSTTALPYHPNSTVMETRGEEARPVSATTSSSPLPLHQQRSTVTEARGGGGLGAARRSVRAVQRITGMFVLLFVCWLPYLVVGFVGPSSLHPDVLLAVLHCALLNSVANFGVYGLADREFRGAIAGLLRRVFCRRD